jgi:hypothetical protein
VISALKRTNLICRVFLDCLERLVKSGEVESTSSFHSLAAVILFAEWQVTLIRFQPYLLSSSDISKALDTVS